MRMRLDVIPAGKATATVILTQDQVDTIRGEPGRARVPLAITYRGKTFRTSISVYRGQWMMVVNAEMRAGGLEPGGSYTVDIDRDDSERAVAVPDDLAATLSEAGVRPRFDAQSYTRRKEAVRQVEEAKRPETRARRIAAIVDSLTSR
jgi:hypothetical protein